MKVYVTDLYKNHDDQVRLYQGTPDSVRLRLIGDYPFLADGRHGEPRDVTVQGLVRYLSSTGNYLVEAQWDA